MPYFILIPFFFLYPPNTTMDFQSAISNIKPKVNKLYIKQQHPYTINPIKNKQIKRRAAEQCETNLLLSVIWACIIRSLAGGM